LRAFPPCEYDGKILSGIVNKFEDGFIRQVEVHTALEPYGSCEEFTCRNHDAPTARTAARRNRLFDRIRALAPTVWDRTELSDIEVFSWKFRRFDSIDDSRD